MSVVVSDSAFWTNLHRYILDKLSREMHGIKGGVDQRPYLLACGKIQALEDVLEHAKELHKHINGGTFDEEENA